MKEKVKICFVSSSGGHYEQLRNLRVLLEEYEGFYVTEKTNYMYDAKYMLSPIGSNDKFFVFKLIKLFFDSLKIWIKESPDVVISNGAVICLPFCFWAKVFRKKFIFIETFARITDASKTGKMMYKYADLFIVQWKSLLEVYPNAIYGGSIY